MNLSKVLYFLMGPKGSGKTHIGTLVDRHTRIKFLRVEPIWLSLQPGEDGWLKVEKTIDQVFQTTDRVMVESLGAGEGFRSFYESLAKKYTTRLIRVKASQESCLERLRSRSRQDHIPVSDEQVIEYNKLAAGVSYDWDLEIENDPLAKDNDIISAILVLDGNA